MGRADTARGRRRPTARQGRGASARQGTGPGGRAPAERSLSVGRPLQARLIALEKRLGLFSEEQSFAADSRFNHPVLLPVEGAADGEARGVVPEGMARIFAEELASLERLGKDAGRCHITQVGPYTVYCRSYFHYDGFRALHYVERDGALVAAWPDEEVLHPDSPRRLVSAVPDAEIEAFLQEAERG